MVQPPSGAVAAPRFRPTSQADLAQSGERTRIRNNLAVLRTLRTLEQEQRPATDQEQKVLARWSGWGAVPKVFDERTADFATERAELLELLSPEEYQAAKTTTLTAYYTGADLVQGIWKGLRELGFEGGNVLEPGCGSGNFVGFAPTDTATPTRMIGVEVDPTSAAIASHLYPDSQVLAESFAETIAPDGAFDAVIGNVPFDRHRLYDPRYNPFGESIHNHFIAKSVQMTKPGGVVAVITSRFTLDGQDAQFRTRLASMADLVGAVRLPIDAHAKAAGTRTVTDVLFLRRRESDRLPAEMSWDGLGTLPGPDGLQVNRYFLDHPEHVVGTLDTRQGQFGPEVNVTAPWDTPTAERFAEVVRSITDRARERGMTIPAPGPGWKPLTLVGGRDASREGMLEVDENNRLTRITDGVRVQIDPPIKKSASELFSLLRIRDAYLELVEAERTREVGDESVEQLRGRLNERYDGYVARYGPINRFTYKSNGQRNPERLGGLRTDLLASRVLALEKFDPTTQRATKVEIFHRRTIAPATPPERAETAADALAISLDTYAEVRLDQIQRLMGDITPEQARRELGTLVYTEPVTEDLIPAAQYLSGDVRTKLRAAQAAARTDETFTANVEALREVIPVDLTPAEIEARLGATWVSAEHVQAFAREILADERVSVVNPGGSLWTVSGGNPKSVHASNTWGTERMPAQVILQNLLQNKAVRVTRIEVQDGKERTVLDQSATDAAQGKAEDMAEKFASWAWEDPDRARDLARIYNDRFNQLALRTYDGSHLTFPGLSQRFKPYPHQRAAIARVLNEQASLLAHGVGAGKTAEMVISIMEMRRLGQARKPAMVVPNHMLEQVSREFAQLYPQAKILVADKTMMSRDYRARFADLAASGDWDVIVFGHNQFKQLPLPNEDRRAYEDQQIAEFEEWITSAENDPDVPQRSVKQLERAKVQLQNRYKKLWASVDSGSATMADCGIDAIVYDEAHEAKNALVRSNIQDAAKDDPSWQAEDLMMKANYIRRHGGKLVFATATPIANSVAEAYVVMRFLRPDLLHTAGIYDFDQWASTFGEIISEFEMKPEGGGFQQKDRFARFMNVPELLRVFHSFADVKLSSELGLDLPNLEQPGQEVDGARPWVEGRQTVVVPPSPELQDYMKELGVRANEVRKGTPDDRWSKAQQKYRPDNMLWISSDGRAAATDLRLVDEQAAADTKMAYVAEQVAQIWVEHQHDTYIDPDTEEPEQRPGSLQMVFCDLGTPNPDPTRYDAYDDLRERLVAAGVPREQIRFVHEARNDKEKADLFASARDGRTQVIVGSTKKMGTGTNMQRRAVALHHVDCPWRPVDIEQREGRLVRQGNANTRVRILSYVTEGSFDAYMWQTALRKLRFIEQIMRGTLNAREVEDVSNTAMSYAEVQALASGNPLMLKKVVVEKHVKKLERAFRNHHQGQSMLERTIDAANREIVNATAAVGVYDRALERRVSTKGDAFRMSVDGQSYDKRVDAADALRTRLGQHLRNVNTGRAAQDRPIAVGELGGFTVTANSYYTIANTITTELTLDCPSNLRNRYATTPTLALVLNKDELAVSTGHGLVMSLENTLNRMEAHRDEAIEVVPRLEAEIEHARANLGAPFERRGELEQALAEEAELLDTLGLPARTDHVLLEGRAQGQGVLDGAVQDAIAQNAVRAAASAPDPSITLAPEPEETPEVEVAATGTGAIPEPVPATSSAWRDTPTAEEFLTAAEQTLEPAGPGRSPDPASSAAPEETPTAAPSEPSTAAPAPQEPPAVSAPTTAVPEPTSSPTVEPAAPAPEPAASPTTATGTGTAPTKPTPPTERTASPERAEPAPAAPSTPREEPAPPQEEPLPIELLREAARANVDLLGVEESQRRESRKDLRAKLNGALETLLERRDFATVSDLVRAANQHDPAGVLDRETYRSRADIESHPDAALLVPNRPVRIEDDFAPGSTGVVRHITGDRRTVLRRLLAEQGFEIDVSGDEALLLNGDPDQRRQAWSAVLAEMERIEKFAGSGYERVFESDWQEVLRREQGAIQAQSEPELIVEEPPADLDTPEVQVEAEQPPVEVPHTAPTNSTPASTSEQDTTLSSPSPIGEDEDAEEALPPAPEDPLQASDGPDQQARAALLRLRSGHDPVARRRDRATVQEGIDYLADADMGPAALDLIHEANRVDPQGAWGREIQRGRLMWAGPESEEHALTGPVIRIDHDGQHQTVVRGTDKDDTQIRDVLKGLKFAWSRRHGFWYLQRRLNSLEQARRVSRLLTQLDDLGRDRITETQWQDLNRAAAERERDSSQQVIEEIRPGVESTLQWLASEHRYREALTTIDTLHTSLREQGHVRLGDTPGTGDEMPFAGQRTELLAQSRQLTQQVIDRFNAVMQVPAAERDLDAAWTLYEELRVISPPRDITDERLDHTRRVLTRLFKDTGRPTPQELREQEVEVPGDPAPKVAEAPVVQTPVPEPEPAEPPTENGSQAAAHTEPVMETETTEQTNQAPAETEGQTVEETEDLSTDDQPAPNASAAEVEQGAPTPDPDPDRVEQADVAPSAQDEAPTPPPRDEHDQAAPSPAPEAETTDSEPAPMSDTHKVLTRLSERIQEALTEDNPDLGAVMDTVRAHLDQTPAPTPEPHTAPQGPEEEHTPEEFYDDPDDVVVEQPLEPAQDPFSRRASIDISGVAPYPDRASAERACEWIARKGLDQWANTVTAAEMAAAQDLPEDDVIALDQALQTVQEGPLAGGPGASATRYADLSGAARAVSERINTDRLHLAQAAQVASEHAERLQATREYNLARMQGAHPAQLARLEARQQAVRYTSAEEAREMSQAVSTVVGRWAQSATSRQVRQSAAQGADVARVRQLWEQVSTGGLDGGPGPSALRFEGFARAVGELNLRLEAETSHLHQLAGFAGRNAARLAATDHALVVARAENTPERVVEHGRAATHRAQVETGFERD